MGSDGEHALVQTEKAVDQFAPEGPDILEPMQFLADPAGGLEGRQISLDLKIDRNALPALERTESFRVGQSDRSGAWEPQIGVDI